MKTTSKLKVCTWHPTTCPPLKSPQVFSIVRTRRCRVVHTVEFTFRSNTEASVPQATTNNLTLPSTNYFATDPRPIILFDGVCNLCNGAVNFMLDWDTQGAFRLAALQSSAGSAMLQRCGRHPDDMSSIVLVQADGQHFIRSEAVLRIAQSMQVCVARVEAGSPVCYALTMLHCNSNRYHSPSLQQHCFQSPTLSAILRTTLWQTTDTLCLARQLHAGYQTHGLQAALLLTSR